MSNFVSLNYVDEYNAKDITEKLKTAFSTLGAEKFLKPKMTILIKLNLPYCTSPNLAKTTHPAVVHAVVDVLNSYGVKCILADSPVVADRNLDKLYFETGMLEVANNTNCQLNHDLSSCKFETKNAKRTSCLYMLDLLNNVDAIVNVGKVKIDERFGYLGATSNLFGLVAGEYKNLLLNRTTTIKDFNNLIIDIFELLNKKLVLNILDGVVAQEAGETQRVLSCLGVSENAFALDAALIDILGIERNNSILLDAQNRGIIKQENLYRLTNEPIDKFKLEDFCLNTIERDSKIHKNQRAQQTYFNSHQKRAVIKPSRCKGCAVCSKICPTGAIMMKYDKNGELFAEIDYSKCIFCFKCQEMCPYKVVEIKTPLGHKILMNKLVGKDKNI